jgi:hypothetical protein
MRRRDWAKSAVLISGGAAGIFKEFNLIIVHVLDDLHEVGHIEPLSAPRTFHEMIGLIFGDAVYINPGFRHLITRHLAVAPGERTPALGQGVGISANSDWGL